jgi:DNA-binding response OmpR family regulator
LVRKLLYTLSKAGSPRKGIPYKTDYISHLFPKAFLIILVMSKETILILDKDFHTQWTLRTILESERYIVLAVDTIERALTNFQEFEVSGLITEDRIDHTNVPEIIRELKKGFPELYVMMLTAENLEEKEYKKIMNAGIDDLFLKPISTERILIHLKKGLRHRKVLLQKKRLEQRLSEIKTNRNAQEVALSRDTLSQKKSFTVR